MRQRQRFDVRDLALLGILFSVSLALTAFETFLPPIPFMPPGVKIGLSNIVTMYCLFCLNKRSVFMLVALKSCFVFMISGFTAFLLSLAGGLLSAGVMILLAAAFPGVSYLLLSVAGAVSHNIGQIIAAALIMNSAMLAVAYLPVLIISGVIMGNITGTLLRFVMPALLKLRINKK